MSHASLLECWTLGGIWSPVRGLARNVVTYKPILLGCDLRPVRFDVAQSREESLIESQRLFWKSASIRSASWKPGATRRYERAFCYGGRGKSAGLLPQIEQRLEAVL